MTDAATRDTPPVMTGGPVPPGPRGLPFLGNLFDLKRDKLGFFGRCAREYGGVVGLRLGGWPAVFVSDPALVESVLNDRDGSMSKGRFFWRQMRALFGNGLPAANGSEWARQRRMMTPAFAARRVNGYAPAMVSAFEKTVADWRTGEVRDVHRDMTDLSLLIALKTLFDNEDTDSIRKLETVNSAVADEIARRVSRPILIPDRFPFPGHRRYREAIAEMDRFCADLVEERRREGVDRGDFFSQILAQTDDEGRPMSPRQIRDEAVGILAASHETSAVTLTWALYLLSTHPRIQDEAAAEVDAVLGDRAPVAEDLRNLPLLGRVLHETMRLYPAIWAMVRQNDVDIVLGGYPLKAGTLIYVSPFVMHRDPRWFPEPDAFRPERWTQDFARSLPKAVYMPFSLGPRLCIGRSFAMLETTSVLAMLLRRHRFTWMGGPARMDASITLRPLDAMSTRIDAR